MLISYSGRQDRSQIAIENATGLLRNFELKDNSNRNTLPEEEIPQRQRLRAIMGKALPKAYSGIVDTVAGAIPRFCWLG